MLNPKNSIYRLLSSLIIIITLLCIFASCKKNDELESLGTVLRKDTEFSISPNLDTISVSNDNEEAYIVISRDTSLGKAFYYVTIENNEIKEKKPIKNLGGQLINYKNIYLNGKEYWQFDISNHQGNGGSYFYSVVDKKVVYEIIGTVDFHLEGSNSLENIKNDGFETKDLEYDKKLHSYGYSTIYYHKGLENYVKDVNNDGYDDLVFYGQQMLIRDNFDSDFNNYIPEQIVSVEETYYYDSKSDSFKKD